MKNPDIIKWIKDLFVLVNGIFVFLTNLIIGGLKNGN